ncbi:MAG: hypothetical protein ACLPHP_22205 [Candidatus Sulfotelmatobacter sp.]
MTEFQSAPEEPTKVDEAASAACIRSGAFALLLSLALVLLIPIWREEPRYAALRVYVAGRFNLALAVDSLDDSESWKKYKSSDEGAESLSIAQLREGIWVTASSTKVEPQSKVVAVAPKNIQSSGAPGSHPAIAPPTGLSASYAMGVPEADRIADSLQTLNDSDILTRTRQVSNYFNFSVARWANKRGALAYKNVLRGLGTPCSPKELEVPLKAEKPQLFVPALTSEVLLNCLNVGDVQELAHFELPTVSNPMELGGRVGPMIEMAPGSLPGRTIDLEAATFTVQGLLFFVVMYFGAFVRDAVTSSVFPVSGTLFGAFSKSRSTLIVLFLALWTPLAISVVVASISRRWIFAVWALFIGLAVLSVHRVLARKSYFRRLDPRLMFRDRRPRQKTARVPESSPQQ